MVMSRRLYSVVLMTLVLISVTLCVSAVVASSDSMTSAVESNKDTKTTTTTSTTASTTSKKKKNVTSAHNHNNPFDIQSKLRAIVLDDGYVWRAAATPLDGTFLEFIYSRGRTFAHAQGRKYLYPIQPISQAHHWMTDAESTSRANFLLEMHKAAESQSTSTTPDSVPSLGKCGSNEGVVLEQYQTDVRDQLDRATSAQFATIAALEAAYIRKYRRSLDLSPQFLNFITKSTAYNRTTASAADPNVPANSCSYWDGGSSHDFIAALHEYGTTLEEHVPYESAKMMEIVRNKVGAKKTLHRFGFDSRDKVNQATIDSFEYSPYYVGTQNLEHMRFGIESYVKLTEKDTRNVCVLEHALSQHHEVIVDFNMTWKLDKHNELVYDPKGPTGSHTLLIVGFDPVARWFYAKNSFGGDSFVRISYKYVRKSALGGAFITAVMNPEGRDSYERAMRASFIGKWHIDVDGAERHWTMFIRRTPQNTTSNGTVVQSHLGELIGKFGDKELHIPLMGRFTSEGQRLDLEAGNFTYNLWMHAEHRNLISGVRFSAGKPVGILLSRARVNRFPLEKDTKFNFKSVVGKWKILIDGKRNTAVFGPWIGERYDNGTRQPVQMSFSDENGAGRDADADIMFGGNYSSQGHAVRLQIFDPQVGGSAWQTVWLFQHTQERYVMSGFTRSALTGHVVPAVAFELHHSRSTTSSADMNADINSLNVRSSDDMGVPSDMLNVTAMAVNSTKNSSKLHYNNTHHATLHDLAQFTSISCSDHLEFSKARNLKAHSGVYILKSTKADVSFKGYCDMDTEGGGWLLAFKQSGFASGGLVHNDTQLGNPALTSLEYGQSTASSIANFRNPTQMMLRAGSNADNYIITPALSKLPHWKGGNEACASFERAPAANTVAAKNFKVSSKWDKSIPLWDRIALSVTLRPFDRQSAINIGPVGAREGGEQCFSPQCAKHRHGRHKGSCQAAAESDGEGNWMVFIR
jgi:flagellum-specific peptidoglycan hydrolase FlgJ